MKELRSIKLEIERFLHDKIKFLDKPEHKTSEVAYLVIFILDKLLKLCCIQKKEICLLHEKFFH